MINSLRGQHFRHHSRQQIDTLLHLFHPWHLSLLLSFFASYFRLSIGLKLVAKLKIFKTHFDIFHHMFAINVPIIKHICSFLLDCLHLIFIVIVVGRLHIGECWFPQIASYGVKTDVYLCIYAFLLIFSHIFEFVHIFFSL